MSMFNEFKIFALRGNVMDLAIGVMIGGAFGKIVNSLVEDVIMPALGLLIGGIDFAKFAVTLKDAQGAAPAVLLKYGQFFNTILSFLIVSTSIFLAVKAINRLKFAELPLGARTADCPHCKMAVPLGATRCGHCTSMLG